MFKTMDFVDMILGISLLIIVVAMVFAKANMTEVLTFASIFTAKQVPANLFKPQQ